MHREINIAGDQAVKVFRFTKIYFAWSNSTRLRPFTDSMIPQCVWLFLVTGQKKYSCLFSLSYSSPFKKGDKRKQEQTAIEEVLCNKEQKLLMKLLTK